MKFYFASKYSSTRFGIRTTECWYNCGWYTCTLHKIFPLALYWILRYKFLTGEIAIFTKKLAEISQKIRKISRQTHVHAIVVVSIETHFQKSWRNFLKVLLETKEEKNQNTRHFSISKKTYCRNPSQIFLCNFDRKLLQGQLDLSICIRMSTI